MLMTSGVGGILPRVTLLRWCFKEIRRQLQEILKEEALLIRAKRKHILKGVGRAIVSDGFLR